MSKKNYPLHIYNIREVFLIQQKRVKFFYFIFANALYNCIFSIVPYWTSFSFIVTTGIINPYFSVHSSFKAISHSLYSKSNSPCNEQITSLAFSHKWQPFRVYKVNVGFVINPILIKSFSYSNRFLLAE